MIACVDSDYDYLLQGATHTSRYIINNKYVFHTYAYAIENYQCYSEMCIRDRRQSIDLISKFPTIIAYAYNMLRHAT